MDCDPYQATTSVPRSWIRLRTTSNLHWARDQGKVRAKVIRQGTQPTIFDSSQLAPGIIKSQNNYYIIVRLYQLALAMRGVMMRPALWT